MQKCAHIVELEKCCQTHIFLQNFVLIQPRTSLPKIYKILKFANFYPEFAIGSSLLPEHQTIVESILNHWCALLVRGKAMRVNNQIEKCYLDKDLLTFYVGNDSYLLKHMKSINFAKDQYNVP